MKVNYRKQDQIQGLVIDGQYLTIHWVMSGVSRCCLIYLRHNCDCQMCFFAETGQKLNNLLDSNVSYKTLLAEYKNDAESQEVTITWLDQHVSRYDYNFLLKSKSIITFKKKLSYITGVRALDYEAIKIVKVFKKFLQILVTDGIIILKNSPLDPNVVKKIAHQIFQVQNTLYGDVFDVTIKKNPINIAYTSLALTLHIDLPYYESPPGLQILHCLEFNKNIMGGESLFLDGWTVAENFRIKHKRSFDILTQIPGCFQKIHATRTKPVHMVYHRPHIALNLNQEITGVYWSPPFEGPIQHQTVEQTKKYYQAYLKFSKFIKSQMDLYGIAYRLNPGDVVIFNNRKILHGRNAFTVPQHSTKAINRWLRGTYVNIDEFASCVRLHGLAFQPIGN